MSGEREREREREREGGREREGDREREILSVLMLDVELCSA